MPHNLYNSKLPVTDGSRNYTLHLADNSLIMGHRLSEWTGHGPMLEQDIAISNIALDLNRAIEKFLSICRYIN